MLTVKRRQSYRLTVWENVTSATQFWIKGRGFTIPKLLQDDTISKRTEFSQGASRE